MLDTMNKTDAAVLPYETREEFDTAVATASTAARAYYDTASVIMVDADYDLLVDRLAATVALHPEWDEAGVTTQVAAGVSAGGDVPHPTPMLSLDKVTDTNPAHNAISENDGLRSFLMRAGKSGYSVEVKLDGNAVRAVYENGRLVLVATRGDGQTGEDITLNALREPGIAGLPIAMNSRWSGEVRGEVFMTDQDFETASNNRVEAGGKPFANPRNATSGSLRAIDRTYDAPMSFGAYSITGDGVDQYHAHTERMGYATRLGFATAASLTPTNGAESTYADSVANAQFAIVAIKVARDSLGFPIDGAVITYDTDESRENVGVGNRTPKWGLAWKFPPREAQSVLRDIEVAVGRTGRMSLTAHIDPVYVDGSTVAKASGHNPIWMQATGLGIGHRVMVVKRGDIIPYISLLDGPQDENVTPWVAPETCPQCGEAWDKTSLLWRCHTPECSIAGRIAFFAGRDQMDIDGLGDTVAVALAETGLVKDVADLYDLTAEQWASLPLGTTSTGTVRTLGGINGAKIMASLEARKSQPFNRVITALGIRMTGRSVGRWLSREFPTMDLLRAATVEQVATIEKMGPIKAQHVVDGLAKMSEVIDRLAAAGVNMGEEPVNDGVPKPFLGQTYVVSGSVPGYTRTTVQERIESLGGRASSSVSKTTTALVTAETDTSKAKKAASLGVPVIDPDEFVKMLEG